MFPQHGLRHRLPAYTVVAIAHCNIVTDYGMYDPVFSTDNFSLIRLQVLDLYILYLIDNRTAEFRAGRHEIFGDLRLAADHDRLKGVLLEVHAIPLISKSHRKGLTDRAFFDHTLFPSSIME